AHVVTPVESIPSLTTNNVAMKMTTGSPNPATASCVVTSPVAHSARAARIATTPMGRRFQMNRTTTAASTTRARVASSTGRLLHRSDGALQMDRCTRSPRDADEVPRDEEERPRHQHHHRVGQHHRDDGAHPGMGPVAL